MFFGQADDPFADEIEIAPMKVVGKQTDKIE